MVLTNSQWEGTPVSFLAESWFSIPPTFPSPTSGKIWGGDFQYKMYYRKVWQHLSYDAFKQAALSSQPFWQSE